MYKRPKSQDYRLFSDMLSTDQLPLIIMYACDYTYANISVNEDVIYMRSVQAWTDDLITYLIKSGDRSKSSSNTIILSASGKYLKAWNTENLMCSFILVLLPRGEGLLWNTAGNLSNAAKSMASFCPPSTDSRIGVMLPPA